MNNHIYIYKERYLGRLHGVCIETYQGQLRFGVWSVGA